MKYCLAIHNHQPVGVPASELKRRYERIWLPLMILLRQRPGLKIALYNSGTAWEFLAEHGDDYLSVARDLLSEKRLELLGGGLYEPLLPLLTDEDALAQLGAMQRLIEELFDVLPRGIWISGRLWEPRLPSVLAKADVEYVLSDPRLAGGRGAGLCANGAGPLVIEDRGAVVRFFPMLGDVLSAGSAGIEECRRFGAELPAGASLVIGLDVDSLYRPGADSEADRDCAESAGGDDRDGLPLDVLGELLDELAGLAEDDGFEPALPSGMADSGFVAGRSWPVEDSGSVSFRERLAARPSVNGLYRKMLHVSRKIQFSGRASRDIREALLKGQCAASLLMTGEDGVRCRMAAWRNLLEAEDLTDARLHGKGSWVDVEEVDYDGDGATELLVGSRQVNAYFSAASGGTCFELDFKPRRVNVLEMPASANSCFQQAFTDIFLSRKLDELAGMTPDELAALDVRDCAWEALSPAETRIVSDRDTRIVFTRDGRVKCHDGKERRVSIEKTFRFAADQPDFKVRYRIVNRGPGSLREPFAVAFGLRAPDSPERLAGAVRIDGRELESPFDGSYSKELAQDVCFEDRRRGLLTRLQFTMCSRLFLVTQTCCGWKGGGIGLMAAWEGPLPENEILELDLAVEFEALECRNG